MKLKMLALTGAALFIASGAQAATISTLGFWDGSTSISAWGGGATNTYGEVLDAAGTSLNSFTFNVNNYGQNANYVAQVYNWLGANDSGGPVGNALFTSSAMVMPGAPGFQAVTVNTGGVTVAKGQRYEILLYDNSNDGVGASWGLTGIYSHPNVTGDVGFAFNNGPSNANGTFSDFGSLAYSASFGDAVAAVPEPATWAMMLMGFGMIGFAARRRQSVKTTVRFA